MLFFREYAEAHTLTLVLYRPDGERKRSVRVLRILHNIQGPAWLLRKSAVSA